MSTLTSTGPTDLLRMAWRHDRPLTIAAGVMLATLAAAVIGLVVDPTVITGVPAWLKPAKFAISIAIYFLTLVWLLSQIRTAPRLVRMVRWVTIGALGIEMVLIGGAAAAGTTSHFNVSTPVHALVWNVMAAAIVVTWLMGVVVAVLLMWQRHLHPALAWGLRLGVVGAVVGMAVAFLMTVQQTAAVGIEGAHTVGAVDGGPGLPIVNWSTEAGDLRAPHFVGIHAMQVIPVLGLVLANLGPAWLRRGHRVSLVVTAGVAWIGLCLVMTWQAMRERPVLDPDGIITAALLGLAVAVGVAVGAVVLHARLQRNGP